PDRAAGTLAAMALWSGIARNAARGRRGRARAFAAASLIANSAMLAAHVRGKVANPRIATGTALSALALVGTLGRG
ncbi:MAG TPA: hypothetical protein VFO60_07315, partial [Candidatus Dormibacteraeota bacterium]|nr:hypothetical protein [Candidatus Dormibacteraeota bacterium]